jgi:hypothetical protein
MIIEPTLLDPTLLSSGGAATAPEADRQPAIRLGHPGRCPGVPTHLSILFDDSGSITAPGGNDPIGNRFDEARLAIDAVARRCRCRQELVSVVHFDVPTSCDLPPTPLARSGVRIENALRLPPDARGNSLLRPSLEHAQRIAHQLRDHRQVLCVLSDFQLFDSNLEQLLEELGGFPGEVHAVVLQSGPPAELVQDRRVTVDHLEYGDPPGALAHAVFAAATTQRIAPGRAR